jgi:cellulose synthase/poly-beta-1,6-N-acetylglucosamine synthase-like glycosyltransferase
MSKNKKEIKYRRYLEYEERSRRRNCLVLGLITMASALIYFIWLISVINMKVWYIAIPFIIVEMVVILIQALHLFNSTYLRRHKPEGLPIEKDFSVDVFIPVCGEPYEIYSRTIKAATEITYANKLIYILDDRGDPHLKNLADEMGIEYFARPTHENSKAGNLNYAYNRTKGDLVLALDADQVPQPEILDRLVGYFKLPKIAFVQTVQKFDVPEGDPFCDKDELFYKIYQSGKDYENSAISCGSGVLYRRAALNDIGGFSIWSIIEDHHTSLCLHDKGWKSVYHDTAFTLGTAPNDILGNYRQRYQWAVDSLKIFFWDNPLKRKGLNSGQKLKYLSFGLHYIFMGFFVPFFFVVPVWSVFTGKFVITAALWMYILYRLPYFIMHLVMGKYTSYPAKYIKSFQIQIGYFPVYIAATFSALFLYRKKNPKYHVTSKKSRAVGVSRKFIATIPQLMVISISAAAIVHATRSSIPFWFMIVNVVWLSWNIICLIPIINAAYGAEVLHKKPEESRTDLRPEPDQA